MFLVLFTQSLEGSRVFYEQLGYNFVEEQHGQGPKRLSTTVKEVPVELYPPMKSIGAEPFFVGVYVKGDTEAVKRGLIENFGGKELEPTIPTTTSGIASLRNPYGILVRLFPQPE